MKYTYTYRTDIYDGQFKSKTIEADSYDIETEGQHRLLHFYKTDDGGKRRTATIANWDTVREVR